MKFFFSASALLLVLRCTHAAPGPRCPVVEPLGIIELPFTAAFLEVAEIRDEKSLFVTSFFNVLAISQTPGPPFQVLERDLVARINHIDDLERNTTGYASFVPEELTDLTPGAGPPQTVWPNEVIKVEEGIFPFEAIIIPQGFQPAQTPGRLVVIDMNDVARTEYIIQQSTQAASGFGGNPSDLANMPRFYHDAVFFDMDNDGLKDIITVRSGLRVGAQFYPPFSELVWFKNPGANLDPNVEWDETTLYGGPFVGFQGPDIFLKAYDFEEDGIPEFVATHFFTGFANATADTGKITIYGAPSGSDWSEVDALDPAAPQVRTSDISTDQGKPFAIEIVDLNGDGRVDILCSNHQPDGTTSWPSDVPGRVYALEQPNSGNIFVDSWTTHILLDDIRPNLSLPGSRSSRLAPGGASAIYPFSGNKKQKKNAKPWVLVGGDEASKVWLLVPVKHQAWKYDATVIFDINEFYGPETTQTPLDDPFGGITISTIGKVVADETVTKNRDLIIYVPVFEARDIHVFRLTSDCSKKDKKKKDKKGKKNKKKKLKKMRKRQGNRYKEW